MEPGKPETTKVSYILRNISPIAQNWKILVRSNIPRKSALEKLLNGTICWTLFSLPNQFIVTLLTCNRDENLSVQCFHIKSDLEKEKDVGKHIV